MSRGSITDDSVTINHTLKVVPNEISSVEQLMQSKKIYCIASGEMEGILKYYMYAQSAVTKGEFFIELQITRATRTLQATIKTSSAGEVEAFKAHLIGILNNDLP